MDKIEDFEKVRLTISIGWANVFVIFLTIPIILLYGYPYYLVWGFNFKHSDFFGLSKIISPEWIGLGSLMVFVLGVVAHELIHGITWACYTKNGFKSIRFGILWKMLTPYCHCTEPLKVKEYIIGGIMPAIILGLIPGIISIVIGNLGLLFFAILFTVAACGDFMIINLLKKENRDDYVQDHPSEAGCFVFRKKQEESSQA